MSLSCGCDWGDYDSYYEDPPTDFVTLNTKRRRRCCSCRELIDLGADVLRFDMYREPRSSIEDNIYGDQVSLAPLWMCEECGGLYLALSELGFCIAIGGSMRELVNEYNENY